MKVLISIGLFVIGEAAVAAWLLYIPTPWDSLAYVGGVLVAAICFIPKKKSNLTKIKIDQMEWSINDFCRGWLITGQTGSGKTACAIRTILHALYADCPDWGGAVVDQKGQFHEIITGIARHYHCEDKLIVLRVGSEPGVACYNLLSYPGISWTSYAGIIIDTAECIGIKLEPFWKSNAETLLAGILELTALRRQPTLRDLVTYVNDTAALTVLCKEVQLQGDGDVPATVLAAAEKVLGFLNLVPATRDGILSSARTLVKYFDDPNIQAVFCPEVNTVDFRQVDDGKIFIISMAQRYDRQRVFFNTFLKLIFMTHAKYRFDDPATLPQKNLIAFIADEAQLVVTASRYSSDHDAVSVIREAKATYILATQSTSSFLTQLKKEEVAALVLNLSSKIYFTLADQAAAESASQDLGLKESVDESRSISKGVETVSRKKIEKPAYSPGELRGLKKYECVIKHPSGKTCRCYLPPRSDENQIPAYYYRDRFGCFYWLPWKLQL